jgi:hypothetical protein
MTHRFIWCCKCNAEIPARLTSGREIYPHREDLFELPFWKCDTCKNYVGCHHKTKEAARPIGNIPTADLRAARSQIHKVLDPIWRLNIMPRGKVYSELARRLGVKEYHTAELKTINDARAAYRAVMDIRRSKGMT